MLFSQKDNTEKTDCIYSSAFAVKTFSLYLIMQVFIPMAGLFAEQNHIINIGQEMQLFFFAVIPQFAAAAFIALILVKQSGLAFAAALDIKNPGSGILLLCPLISAVIYTVYIGLSIILAKLGIDTPMQGITAFAARCSDSTFIILTLSAITAGPFLEELLFRKIFFSYLRSYLSVPGAALISSVFFAAMHFSLPHMPVLMFLGLIFQYSYIRSGSLAVPVLLHAMHNLIAMGMVQMIRSGVILPGTY